MSGRAPALYGSVLVEPIVDEKRRLALLEKAKELPAWVLSDVQVCDLEILLSGAFSPLCGFMTREDYQGSCENMRLANGLLWPRPVTLDVSADCAGGLQPGGMLVLREPEGTALAVLEVEGVWRPDREREARLVYDISDPVEIAGMVDSSSRTPYCVGGKVLGISPPSHYDFRELRKTPSQVRSEIARRKLQNVVSYFTQQYIFRPQFEATFRTATELRSGLLIHAIVPTKWTEDVDHFFRVRSYQALIQRYPKNAAMLNVLPLVLRGSLLRRMILSAIVARNYGCKHALANADSLGSYSAGDREIPGEEEWLSGDLEEALDLYGSHQEELGVKMLPCSRMVYLEGPDGFVPRDHVPDGVAGIEITREDLIRRLETGANIPGWFAFPEVLQEVKKARPKRDRKGFSLFFTGLSGSGKSTLAKMLRVMLLEVGNRPVTLLDGDIVRRHLSKKLGFSREDRDINIRRIGFVAAEITKNGGIAICAPIAPYDSVRKEVRAMVAKRGGFILVHMATPLEVCEKRDPKDMYAKARAGIVYQFTGISDPYELPEDAELAIDASQLTPQAGAEKIISYLREQGYILNVSQ